MLFVVFVIMLDSIALVVSASGLRLDAELQGRKNTSDSVIDVFVVVIEIAVDAFVVIALEPVPNLHCKDSGSSLKIVIEVSG
jgi:hypothetical protein